MPLPVLRSHPRAPPPDPRLKPQPVFVASGGLTKPCSALGNNLGPLPIHVQIAHRTSPDAGLVGCSVNCADGDLARSRPAMGGGSCLKAALLLRGITRSIKARHFTSVWHSEKGGTCPLLLADVVVEAGEGVARHSQRRRLARASLGIGYRHGALLAAVECVASGGAQRGRNRRRNGHRGGRSSSGSLAVAEVRTLGWRRRRGRRWGRGRRATRALREDGPAETAHRGGDLVARALGKEDFRELKRCKYSSCAPRVPRTRALRLRRVRCAAPF